MWPLENGECGAVGARSGPGGESQCPHEPGAVSCPKKPWDCRRWGEFGTITVYQPGLRIYLELKMSNPGKWSSPSHQYLSREMDSFRNVTQSCLTTLHSWGFQKLQNLFTNSVGLWGFFSVNSTDLFSFEIRGCSRGHAQNKYENCGYFKWKYVEMFSQCGSGALNSVLESSCSLPMEDFDSCA